MALFKRYNVLSKELVSEGKDNFDEAAKKSESQAALQDFSDDGKENIQNRENSSKISLKSAKDAKVIHPKYPKLPGKADLLAASMAATNDAEDAGDDEEFITLNGA